MSRTLLQVAQMIGVISAGAGGITILAAFVRKRPMWIRPGTALLFIGLVVGVVASIAGR